MNENKAGVVRRWNERIADRIKSAEAAEFKRLAKVQLDRVEKFVRDVERAHKMAAKSKQVFKRTRR